MKTVKDHLEEIFDTQDKERIEEGSSPEDEAFNKKQRDAVFSKGKDVLAGK